MLAAALLLGCGPSDEQRRLAIERAEVVALELKTQVVLELANALASGPPHEALDACASLARQFTSRLEAAAGASVRRVALRVRNPLNAPDAYERDWLERTTARQQTEPASTIVRHAEVVSAPGGGHELRYLDPIIMQPVCTACHGRGAAISPEVRVELERLYPRDEAVGFRPGDLRGAVSVRVPLD